MQKHEINKYVKIYGKLHNVYKIKEVHFITILIIFLKIINHIIQRNFISIIFVFLLSIIIVFLIIIVSSKVFE
jgi:hypothetical protein